MFASSLHGWHFALLSWFFVQVMQEGNCDYPFTSCSLENLQEANGKATSTWEEGARHTRHLEHKRKTAPMCCIDDVKCIGGDAQEIQKARMSYKVSYLIAHGGGAGLKESHSQAARRVEKN